MVARRFRSSYGIAGTTIAMLPQELDVSDVDVVGERRDPPSKGRGTGN